MKFYFTYSASENGAVTEKWVALPDDRPWSHLSNQTIRVSGSLRNNKLLNPTVLALTEMSEEYLTAPPPTEGLYKVVAVPLTVQIQTAQKTATLNVSAEAIRNMFFNYPDAVNKFYLEASFGKFGFTGVHHPQIDVAPMTISGHHNL